eukprot:TRINITY_DN580_c0_g1_i1.p1 TRINITY_DN580_c0_g1~~TRINITY_DN580_c0_g1_i1.p1  ORF type:complete len:128 (+),score=37.98 TRINITY_DN580_c0_g1_i1:115-498(+)
MPEITPAQKDELACTYAALILHDDGAAISAEKIKKITKAAGITVQPFWPNLFERVLKDRNLDDLILNAGGSGSAPVAVAGATSNSASAPAAKESSKPADTKAEPEKKPKDEEPEESEDEDMGFGLFD